MPIEAMWRLTGIDHLHVHGMDGKFADANDDVAEAARACLRPMGADDGVLPVFSSGQWAGTLPTTYAAIKSPDILFLAGGGILAHPDGPKAGIASLQLAWEAVRTGKKLSEFARTAPPLQRALEFFGPRA